MTHEQALVGSRDPRDAPVRVGDTVSQERAHSAANIRAQIARGDESWIRDWAFAGGDERAAADDAWITRHRAALIRTAQG